MSATSSVREKIQETIYINRKKTIGGLGCVALVGITLLVLGLIAHFNHGQVGIFNMSKAVSYGLIGAGSGAALLGIAGVGSALYIGKKRSGYVKVKD